MDVDNYMLGKNYQVSPFRLEINKVPKNKNTEIATFVKDIKEIGINEILDPDNKKVNINDYIMYNYIKKNN